MEETRKEFPDFSPSIDFSAQQAAKQSNKNEADQAYFPNLSEQEQQHLRDFHWFKFKFEINQIKQLLRFSHTLQISRKHP